MYRIVFLASIYVAILFNMRLFVLTENVCGNIYCLILKTSRVLRYSPFDIQPSVYGEGYESNSTQCKNLLTADCVLERLSLSLSLSILLHIWTLQVSYSPVLPITHLDLRMRFIHHCLAWICLSYFIPPFLWSPRYLVWGNADYRNSFWILHVYIFVCRMFQPWSL